MSDKLPPGITYLIPIQAARFVGVAHTTVARRVEAKTLPSKMILGVEMIPVTPLRIWKREILKAERRREEREQAEANGTCSRCGGEFNGGDSRSHLCPEIEPPEIEDVFRADD